MRVATRTTSRSPNKEIRDIAHNIEFRFLERAALKVPRENLERRISEVFSVFTQHLDEKTRETRLKRVLDSTYIISDDYCGENCGDDNHLGAGISGTPAQYKLDLGIMEVAESYFEVKGHFDSELVVMLGYFDRPCPMNRYMVAANAIKAFYLPEEFSQHGLPDEYDWKILQKKWLIMPADRKRKATAAYRVGNLARKKEEELGGGGLQFTYESAGLQAINS